ncbi:MAG: GIY-YIG nuclease family protein [Oscillospiraceae bacterium]|nr:GIY-YIG nuclease family protein [Oscillospiraceae bacterium]
MYYVYLLRCANGSIYTGITTDPERRFRQHSGEIRGGAKASAMLGAVKMDAAWLVGDRSEASKLEYRIKRLTHQQKEQLILGDYTPLDMSAYERQ